MCHFFLFANGHLRTDPQQLSFYNLSIVILLIFILKLLCVPKLDYDDKLSIADVVCKSCIYISNV